jgi:cytochrome P450
MSEHIPDDLSPAGRDLRAYTDELRPDHPVVRNAQGEWVLLTHDMVVAAALDPERFSSAVSRFLQVPNGLDGETHAAYRAVLDQFLTAGALAGYEPTFERIAAELAESLPRGVSVEAVREIGAQFAVRAQSAWLEWPLELEGRLMDWVAENHAATRSGDRGRLAQVAESFDAIITSVLEARRTGPATAAMDVTSRLMRATIEGRPLTDAEIVSVLRNWTGGDLGSIALCVGVLVHFLATHDDLQQRLRAGVPDAEFDAILDEVLRIDDPFVTNRRVTTCPVPIGRARLPEGARVKLNWTSANRDAAVFGDPDAFDPERNAAHNLVYGIGPHVCPGRLLATMELRVATRALLAATRSIRLDPDRPPEREVAPVGGWARLPVLLG